MRYGFFVVIHDKYMDVANREAANIAFHPHILKIVFASSLAVQSAEQVWWAPINSQCLVIERIPLT